MALIINRHHSSRYQARDAESYRRLSHKGLILMDNYLKTFLSLYLPDIDEQDSPKLIESINQFPKIPITKFEKNQHIYSKGQTVKSIFLLKSGLVRVYDQSDNLDNNHEVNLRFLCDDSLVLPIYVVSQYWQLAGNTQPLIIASESAEAVTNCSGYQIPLKALDQLGEWQYRVKLEFTIRHYRSMEDRLRMLQLQTAFQRYEIFINAAPKKIIEQMPSLHIASYLGITPETLSRVKRQYNKND